MDDPDVAYDLSDSEMLDDASEEAWYASPASALQMAHVVNGHTSPGSPRHTESATSISTANRSCGDEDRPACPHVDSPAHLARTSEQDASNDEITTRPGVLAKIEGIFEAMIDVLLNERGQLSVAIKTRPSSRGQPRDPTNAAQTHAESVQHLCFPGKTEKEAWRFGKRGMRSSL
jgi:hypothetical protein